MQASVLQQGGKECKDIEVMFETMMMVLQCSRFVAEKGRAE